jgi:hypothetical protein
MESKTKSYYGKHTKGGHGEQNYLTESFHSLYGIVTSACLKEHDARQQQFRALA